MLVGNILLVDMSEIIKMAVLYSLVGFLHWKLRKTLLLISTQPEEAFQKAALAICETPESNRLVKIFVERIILKQT